MKKRVISAVVLLTIAVTCIFLSEITRVLFFAVAGIMCAYEYSRGLEKAEVYCAAWVMYTYIGIQAVLAILHAGTTAYIACMAAGVYLAMFSGILHAKVRGKGAIYTVAGLAYPGFIYGLMMMLSASPRWLEVIALGCISSIVCDSFALFGGMRFGKHKRSDYRNPAEVGHISFKRSQIVFALFYLRCEIHCYNRLHKF